MENSDSLEKKGGRMYTIGLDLAVQAAHKAVVTDEQGRFITPVLTLHTRPQELDQLLMRARDGKPERALRVVMEPTSMAWFPVAVYLMRHDVAVYLVNSQEVADLRRYYQRHAKSDRIDARVLARLPLVNPEQLHRLHLPSAKALACQRSCKQLDRLGTLIGAIQNRVQAIDRFAWPGLEEQVFADPFAPVARWMRAHWYDPQRVLEAGAAQIREQWEGSSQAADSAGAWSEALVDLAAEVVALYGGEHEYLDFAQLQAEVCREQKWLATREQQHQTLRKKTVRPLYRQIHPSRNLETLKGVGQDSAAVYASFIGNAKRFGSTRVFRGWSGMVPDSAQSADSEAKGLHITQAGPDLIKKFAYLDAEIARRWDPQMAAIYYDQLVNKGKHHKQAVCACATHLLDRVLVVLREDKADELRDVDGTPVTIEQAQTIIAERSTVSQEVRRRTTKRHRKARAERQAEHNSKGNVVQA
jgi:transposase